MKYCSSKLTVLAMLATGANALQWPSTASLRGSDSYAEVNKDLASDVAMMKRNRNNNDDYDDDDRNNDDNNDDNNSNNRNNDDFNRNGRCGSEGKCGHCKASYCPNLDARKACKARICSIDELALFFPEDLESDAVAMIKRNRNNNDDYDDDDRNNDDNNDDNNSNNRNNDDFNRDGRCGSEGKCGHCKASYCPNLDARKACKARICSIEELALFFPEDLESDAVAMMKRNRNNNDDYDDDDRNNDDNNDDNNSNNRNNDDFNRDGRCGSEGKCGHCKASYCPNLDARKACKARICSLEELALFFPEDLESEAALV